MIKFANCRPTKAQIIGWSIFTLIVVPFIPGIVYAIWENNHSYAITLIIPNGFHGNFRIIEDPKAGVDTPYIHGRYVYRIPSTSVLVVKSLKPFSDQSDGRAQYASGQPLPWQWSISKIDPKIVAIREYGMVSTLSEPQVHFVFDVGAEEDANKELGN